MRERKKGGRAKLKFWECQGDGRGMRASHAQLLHKIIVEKKAEHKKKNSKKKRSNKVRGSTRQEREDLRAHKHHRGTERGVGGCGGQTDEGKGYGQRGDKKKKYRARGGG